MGIPWLTVLTTPRRPQYLQATLAELDQAGAHILAIQGALLRCIAVDGNPADVPDRPGWVKFSVGMNVGSRRALLNTCHAAADGQAGHLLYFEDDLVACQNAVLALNRALVPQDCGFITAFTMQFDRRVARDKTIHTAHKLPGGYWGTQALKIPARGLSHLRTLQIGENEIDNSGDVWLGQHLATQHAPWWKYRILRPSIFEHVGLVSQAHPADKRDRKSADFVREFDALTIPGL